MLIIFEFFYLNQLSSQSDKMSLSKLKKTTIYKMYMIISDGYCIKIIKYQCQNNTSNIRNTFTICEVLSYMDIVLKQHENPQQQIQYREQTYTICTQGLD